MIYEIGWSSYDIRYILIILCFIPLLIVFILFQKRYNTTNDDVDKGILINNSRGSKSHTKFIISLLLIFLMLASLSPIMTLYVKNRNINLYKNGVYDTLTGIAQNVNEEFRPISIKNENTSMSLSSNGNGILEHILKNEIEEGKVYTVYYTYKTKSENGIYYDSNTILRIDKVN